jgi:hypothetical protein
MLNCIRKYLLIPILLIILVKYEEKHLICSAPLSISDNRVKSLAEGSFPGSIDNTSTGDNCLVLI